VFTFHYSEVRLLSLALVLACVVAMPVRAAADTNASRVLGQVDFVHNGVNILTNTGLWNPRSAAVDRSVTPNRIYVADAGNHRVLGWHSIDALKDGSPADVVIGQQDFLSWQFQCNNSAVSGATLCFPMGIAVDGGGNLYIVDGGNNRVLEYNDPFTTNTQPDRVFGQNGSFTATLCNNGGLSAASLCGPGGVAVDHAGNVYIADEGNSRVLEFDSPLTSTPSASLVFGQHGKFNSAGCNSGGVSASSLCSPGAVAADSAGNLYVGDHSNHRVLEYDKPVASNNTTADLVFGQGNSFGSMTNACTSGPSAGALCTPDGIAVDGAGNLYIADGSFSRVQEYDTPAASRDTNPDAVFGQPDFTSSLCNNGGPGAESLCLPFGAATDSGNDLFVADFGNQRVVEYVNPMATHPPDAKAGLVLGQTALDRNGVNGAKMAGLYWPVAVAVDSSVSPNRLYVADSGNSRVLAWHSVPAFANGAPAALVIGQPDFLSAGCNQNRTDAAGGTLAAADTLCEPAGVAVDPAGNLYVADSANFRVLEYDAPFSAGKSAGFSANRVFGQNGSFTSRVENNGGVSAKSLSQPGGLAVDSAGNLYVADNPNNRVLEYNKPIVNDTTADAVFGQGGNFASSDCNFNGACGVAGCPATAASLCGPTAVALDKANNVYIADYVNNRVLEYLSPATSKKADVVIGQSNFTNVSCGTLCEPQGVGLDANGNLYASDSVSSVVKVFNAPLNNGAAPNFTVGSKQCDQSAAKAGTLCGPAGLALDAASDLYAADTFDNRVLEYNQPVVPLTPTPTRTPTIPTPTPSPTPVAGTPFVSSISPVILAGATFNINGGGFTAGSRVNFFVATASGPLNTGPFTPVFTPTQLKVAVPAGNPLGEGVASVQVVNTDRGYTTSNIVLALLQGNPADGIPSISHINGVPISSNSAEPGIAVANVETVVPQNTLAAIGGTGFDAAHGVAVDVFCACAGGKVGPFFVNPGPNLSPTSASFTIPASGPAAPPSGPGSFVVSNKGADGKYTRKSNAVSAPIGHRITLTSVSQSGKIVTAVGAGFSTLSVINLFNMQGGGNVVNLGGLKPDGTPRIPLTLVNENKFTFTLPPGAVPGPGYVQALNPPFVPFTSSGNAPGGNITLH
jgi:sugar lactone lactonase YvrE